MRETCARVLAAALMTGAIATALGLPAAFDSAREPGRGLTAPPSSLQRTVRVPAIVARERPARAERLEIAIGVRPPAAQPRIVRHVANRGAVAVTQSGPRPTNTPATPPAPETRELASTTPPPAAPPTPGPSPRVEDDKSKKGKGHGKGHANKAKAKDVSASTGATEPPAGAGQTAAPPPTEPQGEAEKQKEHGHEKEKGNGHGQKD